jgi:hypothetical protein
MNGALKEFADWEIAREVDVMAVFNRSEELAAA